MREEVQRVKRFIVKSGMYIEKEIPEQEVFIVSSAKLGLKNLIIDLEDNHVLFYIRIGKMKNHVLTPKKNFTKEEILTALMEMNNPLSGALQSGQFVIDTEDKNMLGFGEQHLLESFDYVEFVDTVEGISNGISRNFDIIEKIIETKDV